MLSVPIARNRRAGCVTATFLNSVYTYWDFDPGTGARRWVAEEGPRQVDLLRVHARYLFAKGLATTALFLPPDVRAVERGESFARRGSRKCLLSNTHAGSHPLYPRCQAYSSVRSLTHGPSHCGTVLGFSSNMFNSFFSWV